MPPSDDAQQQVNTRFAWWVCGGLLLAVGLIYGQTLGHVLLDYDDSGFVFANSQVTAGLTGEGIWWAFTEGPFGEWYPLDPLSHMLDCQLFGVNAWGHHLTNVLLHAAAAIALFFAWWRFTGERWLSAFVAAVFAVHPQHVESVAWVAERRDVLSGLLFSLTLLAYLGYVRRGRTLPRYLLVLVLFALGLMAKPMLVTMPPLLLLLDFWPLARIGSAGDVPGWAREVERPGVAQIVLEKLPLFALATADCLLTLRTHNAVQTSLAWSTRIGNGASAGVAYIVQFFYPVDLSAFYPYPAEAPPAWKVMGAVAILLAASAAAVLWRRKLPYVFVGWFWYLGMLLPVLGLVQVSDHARADRYMYLPSIGLSIAVTWAAARWWAGSLNGRWLLAGGAALAIVALTACAAVQTSYWRDDETLWRHALSCTVENGEAENGLATALDRQGRLDEAVTYYRRAQQHSSDVAPFVGLGAMLARAGMLDQAIDQFRQALAKEPDAFLAHVNLGAALSRQGRFDEALEHLNRALAINPRGVSAYVALAHLLFFEQKYGEAQVVLEGAVELEPQNTAVRNDLGVALNEQGKFAEAIPQFEAALAGDPKFVLAHVNLADAYAACGQIDEAKAHYREALEIDPRNPSALDALGRLSATEPKRAGPVSP